MNCPTCDIEMEVESVAIPHTVEETYMWVCPECGDQEDYDKEV